MVSSEHLNHKKHSIGWVAILISRVVPREASSEKTTRSTAL